MFSPNNQRFSRFDMLENTGYFRQNTANANAAVVNGESTYSGPVAFPRMVYWPEEEIIVEGWDEDTPRGPKFVGEQRALKHKIVETKTQFEEALFDGWLDHPAKAIEKIVEANRAAGIKDNRVVPAISTAEVVGKLERELEELRAQLAEAQANASKVVVPGKSSGVIKGGFTSSSPPSNT